MHLLFFIVEFLLTANCAAREMDTERIIFRFLILYFDEYMTVKSNVEFYLQLHRGGFMSSIKSFLTSFVSFIKLMIRKHRAYLDQKLCNNFLQIGLHIFQKEREKKKCNLWIIRQRRYVYVRKRNLSLEIVDRNECRYQEVR